MEKGIVIQGARQNNLKNINLTLPRNKLIVFSGLSGSGKSSLAFDTIYAEGQRKYVESLSAYARQFLGQMNKPDIDKIEGLSPAISIDQKSTSHNPRSTVGTVTEIHDYLRMLYAHASRAFCPHCGKPIERQTTDQIVDALIDLGDRTKLMILGSVAVSQKGTHKKLLEELRKEGYVRVRADNILYSLSDEIILEKNKKHTIEVVIDRIIIKEGIAKRLTDSVEAALKLGDGMMIAAVVDGNDHIFSSHFACPDCGISLPKPCRGFFLSIILSVPVLRVWGLVPLWRRTLIGLSLIGRYPSVWGQLNRFLLTRMPGFTDSLMPFLKVTSLPWIAVIMICRKKQKWNSSREVLTCWRSVIRTWRGKLKSTTALLKESFL